jgi:hypothetical protein
MSLLLVSPDRRVRTDERLACDGHAETALEPPTERSRMSLVVLQGGGIVDFLLANPVFTALLVVMLLFVFFSYLFVRRTLTGLREGYDQGRRGS